MVQHGTEAEETVLADDLMNMLAAAGKVRTEVAAEVAAEATAEAAADLEEVAAPEAEELEAAQFTAREARVKTEEKVAAAAVETAATVIEKSDESSGMIDVLDPVTKHTIRCYKTIRCSGATGIFQKHNFEGLWVLSEGEEVSDGHVHYEHRTPNGQLVHVFHVNSTYGGGSRWVMGPVAGNENGWAFVDTAATHVQMIQEKWTVWMESSWEECRLLFRGVVGGAKEWRDGMPLAEVNDDIGPASGSNGTDGAKKKNSKKDDGTFTGTGVVGGAMAKWQQARRQSLLGASRLSVLETVLKSQSSAQRRPSGVSTVRRSSPPPPAPPRRRATPPPARLPPPGPARPPRSSRARRPSIVLARTLAARDGLRLGSPEHSRRLGGLAV